MSVVDSLEVGNLDALTIYHLGARAAKCSQVLSLLLDEDPLPTRVWPSIY